MPKINPGTIHLKPKPNARGRKLTLEFYPDDLKHNTHISNEGCKPHEVMAWLNEVAEYFIDKAKNKG